tara:strand:+ start:2965 stop:3690 length:726 start_codon:yes stop_codon:yes gene_type:complete
MSWLITGSQPVPVDPIFNNVSLLLHGNGTNGSTTITDSSPSPKTVTAVGNAQISTAIADPFGNSTGVIAFDGAGTPLDRLSIPAGTTALQFGAQDFTIECWVYRLNTNTAAIAVGQSDLSTLAGSAWILYVSSSTNSSVFIGSSSLNVASPNPSINTWAHIALTRSESTLRSFLNGTIVSANANLGTGVVNNGASTHPNTIGGLNTNTTGLNGYIDDFRITKGVARYTAAFTPPTAPFPDI